MKIFSFEKLIVWQKSRELNKEIYKLTKLFPEDEKFGLISQMRRCSISIASNLAEGSGRQTNKDKARFTHISFGSALELLNQLILSNDLEFINEEKYLEIREKISEVTYLIDKLHKTQVEN